MCPDINAECSIFFGICLRALHRRMSTTRFAFNRTTLDKMFVRPNGFEESARYLSCRVCSLDTLFLPTCRSSPKPFLGFRIALKLIALKSRTREHDQVGPYKSDIQFWPTTWHEVLIDFVTRLHRFVRGSIDGRVDGPKTKWTTRHPNFRAILFITPSVSFFLHPEVLGLCLSLLFELRFQWAKRW